MVKEFSFLTLYDYIFELPTEDESSICFRKIGLNKTNIL